jgi:uncharacterized membrane protein YozB (DUF420 family)
MTLQIVDLPHVNALLNGITIILLACGLYFIRSGERARHKACMLAALAVSAMFLVTYVTYHLSGGFAKFGGEGAIRPVYFAILILHVLLAVAITPLVPWTVWRALRGNFAGHRRIARWTWPLWMFVAVSGVVVYAMAVHLFPYAEGPYAHG